MSLFITELAFDDPAQIATAKLGILEASLLAGVLGYWILNRSLPKASHP
jgi:NhaA family Na+:H+ antiporter